MPFLAPAQSVQSCRRASSKRSTGGQRRQRREINSSTDKQVAETHITAILTDEINVGISPCLAPYVIFIPIFSHLGLVLTCDNDVTLYLVDGLGRMYTLSLLAHGTRKPLAGEHGPFQFFSQFIANVGDAPTL